MIYCKYCKKNTEPIIKREINEYFVRGKKIKVKENITYCPLCNNSFDDKVKLSYDAYLGLFNLSVSKLKEIRKSYDLTQELFSKTLRWSEKTVNRYEKAESLPQMQYIQVYQRILNDRGELFKILELNKKFINRDIYKEICSRIKYNDENKISNLILYILKDKGFDINDLVVKLFLIDLNMYKKNKSTITGLTYVRKGNFIKIKNMDEIINRVIRNGSLMITFVEENYDVVLSKIKDHDINIFNKEEIRIIDDTLLKIKRVPINSIYKFICKLKDNDEINFKNIEI